MIYELLKKLEIHKSLEVSEYELLIKEGIDDADFISYLRDLAVSIRKEVFFDKVYLRGLIEISNYCKNNCKYCGIRRDNNDIKRYRLTRDDIIQCIETGYGLGYKTFVLQGGEDGFYTDDYLCGIVEYVKKHFCDCAVTLSLGERGKESFKRLYESGADRYLLRHESATKSHYEFLHPEDMSFENRIESLRILKDLGFQTGCGFMVGSPGQTTNNIARDLKFIEEFDPEMVGIGPFISHHNTPFRNEENGSVKLTLFLLSLIRVMKPKVLLPATTALGSIQKDGRLQGILSGANVLMPNLSPKNNRSNYEIYDNKLHTHTEDAKNKEILSAAIKGIGYNTVDERGDYPK